MRGFHQRGEAENERRTERENCEREKETERSFSIGGGAIQSKAGGLWRLAQFHSWVQARSSANFLSL